MSEEFSTEKYHRKKIESLEMNSLESKSKEYIHLKHQQQN